MTGRTTLAALAHQVRPSGRKPLSGWVRFPQIAAEEFVLMSERKGFAPISMLCMLMEEDH
jgi:hypothetical protein